MKSGDNLISIAKKYGVSVEDLRKANPGVKGDMIRAGDNIKVPSAKSAGGKKKSTRSGKKSKKR